MFPDQNRGEFGVQVSHWSRPSSCGERARVSLINSVWRLQWLDRESCRLNVLHSVKPLSRGLWRTCRVISQSFIAASAAYICTFTTWMLLLLQYAAEDTRHVAQFHLSISSFYRISDAFIWPASKLAKVSSVATFFFLPFCLLREQRRWLLCWLKFC